MFQLGFELEQFYKYVAPNGAGGFSVKLRMVFKSPGKFAGMAFHHGHGRNFFGKIQPVEIFDCKTMGIGSENALVLQLT